MTAAGQSLQATADLGATKSSRSTFDSLALALCLVLAALIVLPLGATVWRIFSGAEGSVWAAFQAVYGNSRLPQVLLHTVLTIGSAIVAALCLGSTMAWLNERTNASVGWASTVLPVVSLLVPPIAGAVGWVLLASPGTGFLNLLSAKVEAAIGLSLPELNIFSAPGLIFVYSLYLTPQVYLVVAAALRNVDPALEEAARVSGRGTLTVLRTVTLPAVRPAIISGALLALLYGLSMFAVPLIVGTRANIPILTVEIVRMLTAVYPPELLNAAVLSLVLLVAVLALSAVSRAVNKGGRFATIGGKGGGQSPLRLRPLTRFGARVLTFGYMGVGCVLPVVALIYMSLQAYWAGDLSANFQLTTMKQVFAPGSQTLGSLTNSVVLAVVSATICMGLAVLLAYQIDRSKRFGGFLNVVTKIPGTVSHVILAIAILAALAGPPLKLGGSTTILLIAYVVIYITQATVSAQSAAVQVGKDLTEASRVSGRGPGETLRRVSLPLMMPGIAAGWVFVFVLVMGDITASAILAGTNSPVVGFTMLSLFQNGTYPSLAALASVVTLISMVVVISVLVFSSRYRKRLLR